MLFAILLSKEPKLRFVVRGLGKPQMAEGVRSQHAAARGALYEAALDQKGFDNVLDRITRLGKRGGDRLDASRAATEGERDCVEIAPVHRIKPDGIDVEKPQRPIGDV